MKKTILVAIAVFSMIACKKTEVKEVAEVKAENFKTFGDSISAEGVISKEELLAKYETLKEGDTVITNGVMSLKNDDPVKVIVK